MLIGKLAEAMALINKGVSTADDIIASQRAEIERLEKREIEWKAAVEDYVDEIEELKADRERLRGALHQIVRLKSPFDERGVNIAVEIAAKTLNEQEEK